MIVVSEQMLSSNLWLMEDVPMDEELLTYSRNLPKLLMEHRGRFVVIHKQEIVGIWDRYSEALYAGYGKCGLAPFLVKLIEAIEQPDNFGV